MLPRHFPPNAPKFPDLIHVCCFGMWCPNQPPPNTHPGRIRNPAAPVPASATSSPSSAQSASLLTDPRGPPVSPHVHRLRPFPTWTAHAALPLVSFTQRADAAAGERFPEHCLGHITPCSRHFGSRLLPPKQRLLSLLLLILWRASHMGSFRTRPTPRPRAELRRSEKTAPGSAGRGERTVGMQMSICLIRWLGS